MSATATAVRLRRSVLFVPASNVRALDKARTLNPDAVILDLEDSVAPSLKDDARAAAVEAVRTGMLAGKEVAVRVNAPETPEGARDLEAIVEAGPDAIVLPKVQDPKLIAAMCAALDEGGGPRGLALWAMIETPRGVLNAAAIAELGARRRLAALVVGANDLTEGLRCGHDPARTALTPLFMQVIVAARAYGLAVIDSVYNAHQDTSGFFAEARQARLLGFDGKTLIHPDQIGPTHEAFHPTRTEIAWAHKVIAAFQVPENLERGAISVDGRMVERMHLDAAHRTLAAVSPAPA